MEKWRNLRQPHQVQHIEIPILDVRCHHTLRSAQLLPCPCYQSPEMSYCRAIGLVLCLQLLSYSVTAQNAAANATAMSGTTASPAAGGSSIATAIASALSSGNAPAAANAIAAAQSAQPAGDPVKAAYAAAFAQVSLHASRPSAGASFP